MTPDPFRAALDALVAAHARLSVDRGAAAYAAFEAACAEVRRLHEPVAQRSAERWRKTRGMA